MDAFVLPALAAAMAIYLVVCAWLIFAPSHPPTEAARKLRSRR